MTKRIVSGLFILAAVAALSLILADALDDGEQLVARFLIAVIVAALGLYVISDLRLKADEQATESGHTKQVISEIKEVASNSPAFMATVTRKKESPAATSHPTTGPHIGANNPFHSTPHNQFPPTQLEAIPANPRGPVPAAQSQRSETTSPAIPVARQTTQAKPNSLDLSTLPPPTFESRSEPTIMLTNRSLATAGTPDTTGFYMADIRDADSTSKVDLTRADESQLNASVTRGLIGPSAVDSRQEPYGVENKIDNGHQAHTGHKTNPATLPQTPPRPSTTGAAPGASSAESRLAQPKTFDPANTGDTAGWLAPIDTTNTPSRLDPTATTDLGRPANHASPAPSTISSPPSDPIRQLPNNDSISRLGSPNPLGQANTQDTIPPANRVRPTAKPVQRPQTSRIAPVVHLRRSASAARADDIEAAIKAGEIDVIASLVRDGLLSTNGPITDEEVQMMVYVAFTSNELRAILQSDGTIDGHISRREVQGLDVFVDDVADVISLVTKEHRAIDLSERGGDAAAPAARFR